MPEIYNDGWLKFAKTDTIDITNVNSIEILRVWLFVCS